MGNKLLKKNPADTGINCISFLDEGEEILGKRTGRNNDVVSTFLVNLERDEEKFAFITATNHVDKIDDAIRSRATEIEVPTPKLEDIKKIIQSKFSVIEGDDLEEIAEFCLEHHQSNQYPYKFEPLSCRDLVSALDTVVTRKTAEFSKAKTGLLKYLEKNKLSNSIDQTAMLDELIQSYLPKKDDILLGLVDKLWERLLIKKKKDKKMDASRLGIANKMYRENKVGLDIISKWRQYGRYPEEQQEEDDDGRQYVDADEEESDKESDQESVQADSVTPEGEESEEADSVTPEGEESVQADSVTPEGEESLQADSVTPEGEESLQAVLVTPKDGVSVKVVSVTPKGEVSAKAGRKQTLLYQKVKNQSAKADS